MIARPTAASAAATTMTKKTNTCPCNWPSALLNVTNARLTALSISSMDMKMVMMLRLKTNPTTPNPNKTALSTRKYEVGTTSPPEITGTLIGIFAARQDQRAQQCNQDQKRRQLKRKHVFAEQQRRKVARRNGLCRGRAQMRSGAPNPVRHFHQEHDSERHANQARHAAH